MTREELRLGVFTCLDHTTSEASLGIYKALSTSLHGSQVSSCSPDLIFYPQGKGRSVRLGVPFSASHCPNLHSLAGSSGGPIFVWSPSTFRILPQTSPFQRNFGSKFFANAALGSCSDYTFTV